MTDSLDVALHALTAARAGSILLAAGAIALPIAAVVLLARWRPPGGRAMQAGQRTLGSLVALVPRYLPDSVLRAAERSPLGRPLQLERVHEHFVLRVRERAPGVSSCDYVSATRRWYCSGYF